MATQASQASTPVGERSSRERNVTARPVPRPDGPLLARDLEQVASLHVSVFSSHLFNKYF